MYYLVYTLVELNPHSHGVGGHSTAQHIHEHSSILCRYTCMDAPKASTHWQGEASSLWAPCILYHSFTVQCNIQDPTFENTPPHTHTHTAMPRWRRRQLLRRSMHSSRYGRVPHGGTAGEGGCNSSSHGMGLQRGERGRQRHASCVCA
jgi:hypothetical protein